MRDQQQAARTDVDSEADLQTLLIRVRGVSLVNFKVAIKSRVGLFESVISNLRGLSSSSQASVMLHRHILSTNRHVSLHPLFSSRTSQDLAARSAFRTSAGNCS